MEEDKQTFNKKGFEVFNSVKKLRLSKADL